jgi:protein-disulfide isomerase
MIRRALIVITSIAAIGIFLAGGYFYSSTKTPIPPADITISDAILLRPHSPVLGLVNAPVTLVEFFDPACEACRAFHPVVKKILNDFPNEVRVVLRYAALHSVSEEAIRILEASRIQGKFDIVLERLLETQEQWSSHGQPTENIWNVVRGTGLDIERARVDALLPDVVAVLNQDAFDLKLANVKGTPTFFVNGKLLQEFGANQLYEMVKAEVGAR